MQEEASAPKGHPTSVRLDPDVRERLTAYVTQSRRSFTSAINYLLDKALRAEEEGPAEDLHLR